MNKRSETKQAFLQEIASSTLVNLGFEQLTSTRWCKDGITAAFESVKDKYGAYIHSLVITVMDTTKKFVVEYPAFSKSVRRFLESAHHSSLKKSILVSPTMLGRRTFRCAYCGEHKDDIELTISDDLIGKDICVPCLEKSRKLR